MPRKRKLYKNPKELATLLGVLLLVIVIPLAVWLAKTETKLNPKAQTSLSINNMASFTVRKTPQIEKPEYIAVPSGAVTQGLSFTLEAWIKHNGQAWDLTGKFDNRQYIANYSYIHSGYNNSVQFVLEPNKNLSIHLWIKEGMADIYHEYVEGKSFLKTGEWYHIAAVRDQNTRKLSLYVNGIKDGEANGRQYFTSFLKEAYYIGSKQSSSNFFQGLIDEFRDSSIARYTTPTFSVPKNPFTADSYTNVLYHLDETGWATTAIDSSGNGRNGTVLNVEFIPSTCPSCLPHTLANSQP